ncbi:MAG: C-GCAxxG-C-C family protein [Nitrospinales bacterium]
MEVFQDMINKPDDSILKAFTGLEGGVVASGSTCGVVSGGAMGLAISHYDEIINNGLPAQIGVLSLIEDYVNWFDNKYHTTYCRERTGTNFYSGMGQLRYFLPGDKVAKCMWHIRGSLRHLNSTFQNELPKNISFSDKGDKPFHCAKQVLTGIKEQTGITNERLENLSFVFDGGVGLQGGVCGALAGAIMGINILVGMDIRSNSYFQNVKAFTIGHYNLLRDKQIGSPEPFNVGKQVVEKFKKEAGELECKSITGKRFSAWDEFQEFVQSSDKCAHLIKMATNEASKQIETYKQTII